MEHFARASDRDHPEIAALLASAGLPHEDIAPHLETFTVARDDGRMVGVLGLEVHGTDALLRSLAVAPEQRGRGLARRLYATVIGRARELGVERLFVLTTTAAAWFGLLGFNTVSRDEVPETICRTEELQTLCPASAECLVRRMPQH